MSVYTSWPKRKPCTSDCATCDHKANPDGGYCYMFKEEPEGVCYCHTSLKPPFDVLTELMRSGAKLLRSQREQDCGCRIGECESKPTGCRMAHEVATRDPEVM